MREARIILPSYQQDNTLIDSMVDLQLNAKLVDAFGGYTVTGGEGVFKMADGSVKKETVSIYDIAMEDHLWPKLSAIAIWLCGAANQECVYTRRPDGDVLFYTR